MYEKLKQFGLSEKEARFYYHALKLGTFSLLSIANSSNLKRPTCYLLVDQLIKKGLISIVPSGRKKIYKSENTDYFIDKAKQNLLDAKKLQSELKQIKPTSDQKPEVYMYTGQEGVRKLFNHMIENAEGNIYYLGSVKEMEEAVGEIELEHFIKERIRKKVYSNSVRIKEDEIANRLYIDEEATMRKVYLAPQKFKFKNMIAMYNGYVWILAKEKEPYGLMIHNQQLFQTMFELYESIKEISTPINPRS